MQKIVLSGDICVNCYIISHNKKCYIIDPGNEKSKIIEYVTQNDLEVLGILLTHGHFDHTGAVDCFEKPVYVFEKEYNLLVNDKLNGYNNLSVENKIDFEKIDIRKFDLNHKFLLDDRKISFIHTPGHTSGSVCFIFDKMIFTGDTLFKGAVGRWDFPTGNIAQLKKSLIRIIDNFDDDYEVHPGHNDSSYIGIEKEQNNYYKMWKVGDNNEKEN
ncbi:MAG: MBL fold metallo-hydrolase [Bacilli bacterium]